MSVDKELFQAALRITERYLPDPATNPSQQQVAAALSSKLANTYRVLQAVAVQIAQDDQQGIYAATAAQPQRQSSVELFD